jgi:uncharacterized membrane protein (UPF0136 family)
VVEGSRNDNLIEVIMEAFIISGGLQRDQIAQKLIYDLGKTVLLYFKATRMVLQNKFVTIMLLILYGSIVWPTTLI